MKKEINDFINEMTDNFSELFVETFFIRFLADYDKKKILPSIELTNEKLRQKIIKRFQDKLNDMGYKKEDYYKFVH